MWCDLSKLMCWCCLPCPSRSQALCSLENNECVTCRSLCVFAACRVLPDLRPCIIWNNERDVTCQSLCVGAACRVPPDLRPCVIWKTMNVWPVEAYVFLQPAVSFQISDPVFFRKQYCNDVTWYSLTVRESCSDSGPRPCDFEGSNGCQKRDAL